MGRLGVELGLASRVLQPRCLDWLAESLSAAAPLVSSATDCMGQPSGLPRRLALSSAKLSSPASSYQSSRLQPSAVRTGQSAGLRPPGNASRRQSATRATVPARHPGSSGTTGQDPAPRIVRRRNRQRPNRPVYGQPAQPGQTRPARPTQPGSTRPAPQPKPAAPDRPHPAKPEPRPQKARPDQSH